MSNGRKAVGDGKRGLSLTEVLQALADPVRLEIVRQLNETSDKACGTFGIDKPKSTMSHHFNVLRTSGVLGFEKHGSSLVNFIQRERLDETFPGLLDSILENASRAGRPELRRKQAPKAVTKDQSSGA